MARTKNRQETYAYGKRLGGMAQPGEIYCLIGDLGVGKTVFAQGFAEGLGIDDIVCSPTFTILQTYENGRLPLYHFDVYRIADPLEMDEIGFEEFLYGDGVCLIEWANLIADLLPPDARTIWMKSDDDCHPDARRIAELTWAEYLQRTQTDG